MGFFDVEDLPIQMKQQDVHGSEPACSKCKLYKAGCLTPKMQPTGNYQHQLMVIAEAPGAEEDKKGIQLIGPSGQYVRSVLVDLGYNLDEDFIKLNAVNCRPPNNRTPTNKEIEYCRPMITSTIEQYQPKVILLLGMTAVKSVIGVEWTKDLDQISSWTGFLIPSRRFNAWLAPVYHPSFVIRNKDYNPVVDLVFRQDVARALTYEHKPLLQVEDEKKCSQILFTNQEVYIELRKLLRKADQNKLVMAFDYETSGLKPHKPGHQIHCVSFSYDFNKAYAFWWDNEDTKLKRLWKKVLRHPNILKVAHNMKYEDTWTYFILGYSPDPWHWDTMQVAHILDNRPHITSLKRQYYLHFGLAGYDDDVKKFLQADTSNTVNTVDRAPKQKILLYNAIDSLATFRLYCYQHAILHQLDPLDITNLELGMFAPYVEPEEDIYARN